MKSKTLFAVLGLTLSILFTACNGGVNTKNVTLKNETDSLNYALGLINGEQITANYFRNDSTGADFQLFIEQLDKKLKSKGSGVLFAQGEYIGAVLKSMLDKGLDFNEDLKADEKMLLQGFINGTLEKNMGVEPAEAEALYQMLVRKIMERKNPLDLGNFNPDEEISEN